MAEQLWETPEDLKREGGLPPDADGYCYLAAWHFDVRMEEAAKRLLPRHGNLMERYGWWMVAAAFVLAAAVGIWLLPGVPTMLVGCMAVYFAIWLAHRAKRMVSQIVNERLCLRCAYPLLKSPVDDAGYGRCPECGRQFNAGEYRRPPKNYKRMHAELRGVVRTGRNAVDKVTSASRAAP